MIGFKKATIPIESSENSFYANPLIEPKYHNKYSEKVLTITSIDNKENINAIFGGGNKEL